MPRQPSIFISHKHADQKIAREIRKFLNRWSLGKFPIFESSDPLAQGPRLGHVLTSELKMALWNTGVVFLIYTSQDQDWSYCMWECGVATKPGSPETRIIVLQCGAEVPPVFEDQVRVDVRSRADVLKLAKVYLTDPDFFPGVGIPVAPGFSPDGPEVQDAAAELHKNLSDVIPKREVAEWSTQPLMRIELKIEDFATVVSSTGTQADFNKSITIRDMDPQAWHIFGIAKVEHGMTFDTLVKHWAEGKTGGSPAWVEDVRAQVLRAANRELPEPHWTQVTAADAPERYSPMLTRAREIPSLEVLQFDLSLVPFEEDRVLSSIGDPYLNEYRTAAKNAQSFARSLAPYLAPTAERWFSDWSEYVRRIVTDGDTTRGPERLEITRLIVQSTRKHVLIEPLVAVPKSIHSGDWLAFYNQMRDQSGIEKGWVLCVEEDELRHSVDKAEAAFAFFQSKNFSTLYCTPSEVRRATGRVVPHNVIEDYGDYVKILSLTDDSYTAGEVPNELHTIFRATTPDDRRLLRSMIDCATPMTAEWFKTLREAIVAA